MIEIVIKTTDGKGYRKIRQSVPSSWEDVNTELFIKIIKEWDFDDWFALFNILSGNTFKTFRDSKNMNLEVMIFKCIEFVVHSRVDFDKLEMPSSIIINGVVCLLPKKLGALSIGQAIQARKSLEGIEDVREGISIVTAIYLQPIIDNAPFDHLRAIELEQSILKMPITQIYPIGFFLVSRLKKSGSLRGRVLNHLKQIVRSVAQRLRESLALRG